MFSTKFCTLRNMFTDYEDDRKDEETINEIIGKGEHVFSLLDLFTVNN